MLLAIRPLTAAQIMLLVDRYLGGHFFDTQAGGSAVMWMHFFWIFGHPEVYVLIIPGLRHRLRDHSRLLAQADLRLPHHGGRDAGYRVPQPGRVGASHVHRWHDVGCQRILRATTMSRFPRA